MAVLVFVGIAAGCSREEEATPAEIVQAIEHQVGPSNAPASATIPWMPYELPLPAGAQPVLVGNTRVYLNAAPDTAIVVRPTVNGVQTFMYLSGPEAPDHYGFKFTLLPNTKLEKANNGSIIMVDTKNGNAVPVLKQPWAVSTEARLTYHTDFSVSHSTVTQIIDLQNARFPLIADPDFEDPLTQIIEGRVPAIAEARSTAKDGPPTYIPGGLGRFYAGPNGLEIRFTSSGTLAAIQLPYALSGAGGEAAAALLAKVLAKFGPVVATAFTKTSNVAGLLASYTVSLPGPKKCLGMTVPRGALGAYIGRYTALTTGRLMDAVRAPGSNDTKVWLERCNPDSSTGQHNNVQPPVPPATRHADTQPETPKTPIPPVPQPSQPTSPPPKPAPPAPSPVYHDVNMTDACRTQYNDASLASKYQNWNDPNSWVCINSDGTVVADVISVQAWCSGAYPGSKAVTVNNTAYGWRCKE